ncbi:gliding motility-associated C-terminal domain-containing protein [Cecembia sp.]|uniref:T9SS type B sorting domain-containing protein n=1 Tax=Cecembia sp. TaxID=1898110 RepID=UPI0025BDCB62|nr:gliding motility-associated C-terminal domain-containing protein [Cecembia sp.]
MIFSRNASAFFSSLIHNFFPVQFSILRVTCILLASGIFSINFLNAQTQPPSITSGVTFQWDAPQPTPSSPANLVSVTVDDKVYDRFSFPSRYELTRLGPSGHNQNRIVENGVFLETNSSSPTWNASALAAFSSPNLNFKFDSDGNGRNICSDFDAASTTDAQIQSLFYDNLQVVNQDGIVGISTRNANSCVYIEIVGSQSLGGPETVLGSFFARPGPSIVGPVFGQPAVGADYWRSGRVNSNNGNIGIALFRLDQVAPLGAYITEIRYVGANVNHADGKVFLLRTSSVDLSVTKTVNNSVPDFGESITFTVSAINNGPLNATNVQVRDLLPSGFTFASLNVSKGSYNIGTGIWAIGNLSYGEIATLQIGATVNTSGNYTNTAEITPITGDPNPDNNISSITAAPVNAIVANDLLINATANTSAAGNVLENDRINNLPITIDDVNITSVDPSNPLVSIDPDTGEVFVGGVPSGTYTISYTICELGTDPEDSNCSTATVTVQVENLIVANDDLVVSAPNNTNAGNVLGDNGNGADLLNGDAIDIDLVNITSVVPSNPLVTIDVDSGIITVGDVPVGIYQIEYSICESGTVPEGINCSTATVTVQVQNLLVANDDVVNTTANNPNSGNIFEDNGNGADTFNGIPITSDQVNITVIDTSDPLVTIDTETGNILVGEVSSGTYIIEYSICEAGTDPPGSNCSTAIVNVQVLNPIVANDDMLISTADNPNAGNVLEDNGNGTDLLNGEAVSIDKVNIAVINTSDPSVTLDTETGNVIVGEVASGTYIIEYSICEAGTDPLGANCSTATVTVQVQNLIVANDDIIISEGANPNAGNVLEDNGNGPDMLFGEAVSIGEVDIAVISASDPMVTVDTETGNIVVGEVPSGSYTIVYSICEAGTDPADANCSTATVTVQVQNPIVANEDIVNSAAGNPNAGNILEDNGSGRDLFKGEAVGIDQVNISIVNTSVPSVTIDNDTGNIVVGEVPSGTYTITYSICEAGTNPSNTNCSTATVTVQVQNLIVANDGTVISSANNSNAGNIFEDNGNGADTFNGAPLTPDQVNITSLNISDPLITIDPVTGNIAVGDLASGTYTIAYSICEMGSDPENCDSALVTLIVDTDLETIVANNDNISGVQGANGANNVINVLDNDRINGGTVNIDQVVLIVEGIEVTEPVPFLNESNNSVPNIVLNPDGSVDVAANTADGTYTIIYSICSSSNPENCDSAIVTVIVNGAVIVANDDNYGPFDGTEELTFGNVFENDFINGSPVNPTDVFLILQSGNEELTLNEDGSITLAANTPAGEYMLIYSICSLTDLNNCDFAFVTVTVHGEMDIAIEKTSNDIEIWGNDAFDYFINVTNTGTENLSDVLIEDLLPEGISFQSQEVNSSVEGLQVNFDQEDNRLRWTVPLLPTDAFIAIRLTVVAASVTETSPQSITNNATVVSGQLSDSATDTNSINPFFIPNVITPNGNGLNDTFEIVGINKFVKNDIIIFNRYGDHVFEAENYVNDWDATGQVAGTYFYIFRGEDRQGINQEFKGWIQVIKK